MENISENSFENSAENSICEQFRDELDGFIGWIKQQPQLPQNMRRLLLLRYLKVCDFNQEKARNLLVLNLRLREENPHLFVDRDIHSEKLQSAFKTIQACPLPSYTEQKHSITIFRFSDYDPAKYDVVDTLKMIFMMSDTRFISPDPIGLTEGEIGIMDFNGFGFRHFLKVAGNLSSIRLYLRYVQEAVPFRIKANHFVNCSPAFARIMSLVRPFIKKEIFDVMHFHTCGYDTLYEHVPREFLPSIYGGGAGNIEDIHKAWVERVESQNDYLNNTLNWKCNESKSLN